MDCQLQFSLFITSCCSAKEGWDNEALLWLSKIECKDSTRQTSTPAYLKYHWCNQYFTLLDQSEAYHQLHLHPDSQKLAAFILTPCLTESPISDYPDYNVPFILHTDASSAGLGCGLFQEQDGTIRVTGYGSRTLVGLQEKYHSSKLEFLALKWAICDYFRDFVLCSRIPCLYRLQSSNLNQKQFKSECHRSMLDKWTCQFQLQLFFPLQTWCTEYSSWCP